MTRDEIIRMAREAGWHGMYSKPLMSISFKEEQLLHFVKLVIAADRARPQTIKARLLDQLIRHPDGLTPGELRERTGARDARCILHKLYREGFVARSAAFPTPTGGRQHRYWLKT